ncbi:MAG: DUF2254 domain-containing protein [Phycisphaerales bacterium]|nr:DUF2254 domain-containing protein [Phycisphaerales bacterium]
MLSRDFVTQLWDRIRTSLWFVPGVMAVGAIMLAATIPWIDDAAPDALASLPLVYSSGPAGARAVLSTIATSMITIAGVVFSMTIVSLQLASSQFGPRLLRTFLRDRVNQVVLGTFIATFLYCVLVMPRVDGMTDSVHVPHLAITLAIALALLGLGMLVYFIDHVAQSIHADAVVASVANELDRTIDSLYPEAVGTAPPPAVTPPDPPAAGHPVAATSSGYLRFIDGDALLRLATDGDLVIHLATIVGRYVVDGAVLATIDGASVAPATVDAVRDACVLGSHRSALQDVSFPFEQLAEMAVRALSAGINDPTTAIHCVDRIGSGLARLVARDLPSSVRIAPDGAARLVAPRVTLADVLRASVDPIARNAGAQFVVWMRLLAVLALVRTRARRTDDRETIDLHVSRVLKMTEAAFDDPEDRRRLAAAAARP